MNDPRPVGLPEWAEVANEVPLPLRLRVEDYILLDNAGAFQGYARTELLGGEIVYMNAQHRPHWRTKMAVYDALRDAIRAAGLTLTPFTEGSVAIPPADMPEPDVAVTSEPDGDGYVPVASVVLVVEVSDASLTFDLGRKRARYALAGVPEYWVADINARVVHQFWVPTGETYSERRLVPFGEPVEAATIARLSIPTTRLG
ncbi:Uma2 family endonuclease [Sphingomonas sp.]|uniref:Uma2 family endonuclease n=1 Tax=Sphingomonas sp. TaxID=28214 RepID=UPI003B00D5FA